LFCSSCGHDNPRENRYCGMCGTPFPHRPLTVPDTQSTLTFNSAPISIAPSPLPLSVEEHPLTATPPEIAPVEEVHPGAHTSLPEQPLPAPDVKLPEVDATEAAPAVAEEPVEPVAQFVQAPEVVPATVAASVDLAPVPDEAPVDLPKPEPSTIHAELPPPPVESHLPAIASAVPAEEAMPAAPEPPEPPAPVPVAAEPAPAQPPVSTREPKVPTPTLPEIRRYAPVHHAAPTAHPASEPRTPAALQRPPAPQSLEPPPSSAGMPTFQSVAEASGAPTISPFEPPVEKHPDEERELQEFVASFRYNPPVEAIDELTMRSEVPVIDAEAPVTASHPSFDDDVPPPPEAGPHPTGQEYYPAMDASAERSRFLEIRDTREADPSHRTSHSSTSFLGLGESPSDAPTPLDELDRPARSHKFLWMSLAALIAVFGALGYLEGRAEMNHTDDGPIAIAQVQYAKLRQRLAELTTPAPPKESPAAETPATAGTETKPQPAEQPVSSAGKAQPASSTADAPASSAGQPNVTPNKPPDSEPAATQTSPATESKSAATAPVVETPQKVAEIPLPKPVEAKPKSKPDPGQQELAKAMQASDPAAAAAWLWKATSRGNSVAPVRLADMYIKGKGVPHSCEQALVLLRSEAAKENAPARNRLAALYANGTCVARDRVKAYQLMSSALSADPTSEWAEQNRKELLQQMTPEERAQAEKYR